MSIPFRDFTTLMGAERKLGKGIPLTELSSEEQRVVKTYGVTPKRLCGCGCGKPLEPDVDGRPYTIDGKVVNSDCWFEQWGEELEKHPIITPRPSRGG